MFFWKRRNDNLIVELLEAIVDQNNDESDRAKKRFELLRTMGKVIMAKQDEFNTKLTALSTVLGGVAANQVNYGTVITNLNTVVDNLKGQVKDAQDKATVAETNAALNAVDFSAIDGVLAQAQTVKDNGDKILNPEVTTPPAAEIPTVPEVQPTPGDGETAGQSPEVPAPVETIPETPAADPAAEAPVDVPAPTTDAPAAAETSGDSATGSDTSTS